MFALLALQKPHHFGHRTHFRRTRAPESNSIPSSGTATFTTNVKVRAAPSTSAEHVATYSAGESVKYDQVVTGDSRTWISYIGGSGNRRYCCAIDSNGAQYITVSGSSSGGSTGCRSAGIPFKQSQSSYAGVRKSGCLFCACCWMANFNSISQVDNAFIWCCNQGYVRQSDAYCQGPTREELAKTIANHYGTTFQSCYKIKQGTGHFYVVDGSGNEVYNSAGWGWGH